jgi:hypothetical protein
MFSIYEFVRLRYVLNLCNFTFKIFTENPVLAIPFACVKSPITNRITSPERVPILQSPKNSTRTPHVKPLRMNLPPIPQLIPAPHQGASQNHKKGRTLAEMRANIQERRQSVIRYCPPGSAIPTRVIKSLQQVDNYKSNSISNIFQGCTFRPRSNPLASLAKARQQLQPAAIPSRLEFRPEHEFQSGADLQIRADEAAACAAYDQCDPNSSNRAKQFTKENLRY